jgi:hypothetical protein
MAGGGQATAIDSRTVRLEVPARSGYVLLARLALSAVCRLTSFSDEDVADLKLAVTEAASNFVAEGEDPTGPLQPVSNPDEESVLRFSFGLDDAALTMEIGSDAALGLSDEERELSRAILNATVDDCYATDGMIRLVKHLPAAAG